MKMILGKLSFSQKTDQEVDQTHSLNGIQRLKVP